MTDGPKPMGMFLQDPTLPDLVEDFDFATTGDFLEGTGSSRFCVRDVDPDSDLPLFSGLVWKDEDLSLARFRAQGLVDNPRFHQVNAFAVLTRTLGLVEEEMGAPIRWREGGPLIVRPHAFEGLNAYYSSASPSLNFGYATSPFRRAPVWTCLSHDVVAHELGHAVLDNFRPLLLSGFEPDAGALHESIGDLLAMFSALQHEAVVRRMFADSGGDMSRPSVITSLAEEFGVGLNGFGLAFLRSSLDVVGYADAPEDPHSRSVIWTGAIYELMSRLVERALQGDRTFERFVAAVVEASRWTRGMLIRALHYMPPAGVTLPQLARLVWEADARVFPDDSAFRDIAREVFEQRGLWDPALDLTAPDIGGVFESVAGAGSAALAAVVAGQADALRIPSGQVATALETRLRTPQLITTTRNTDKVTDEQGRSRVRTIVEHYLNYAYDVLVPTEVRLPDGGRVAFGLTLSFGGTLVMDEDWKAVLLAAQPQIDEEDMKSGDPVVSSIIRAVTRAQEAIQRLVGMDDAPFVLTSPETGPPRIVRRDCRLQEHLRGIGTPRQGLAFVLGRT
ncbi:hypothetical protein ACVGOW_10685 [Pseudonocardia saturnea]